MLPSVSLALPCKVTVEPTVTRCAMPPSTTGATLVSGGVGGSGVGVGGSGVGVGGSGVGVGGSGVGVGISGVGTGVAVLEEPPPQAVNKVLARSKASTGDLLFIKDFLLYKFDWVHDMRLPQQHHSALVAKKQ